MRQPSGALAEDGIKRKDAKTPRRREGWPSAKTFASLRLCALALKFAGLKSKAAGARRRTERGRPRPRQCSDGNAHSPIRCRTVLPRCCARGRARSGDCREPFRLGNGFWRDAENGNRDGRAPQQRLCRAPKVVWGGRRGKGRSNFQRAEVVQRSVSGPALQISLLYNEKTGKMKHREKSLHFGRSICGSFSLQGRPA